MRPFLPVLVCLGVLSAVSARAETINVFADQAKIMALPGDPATMIIGNPMIAEVTVQNGVMAIHGRHFGTTNLIILNQDGMQIASYEINVQQGGGSVMQVFKGGARMSFNCEPGCESIAVPGDEPAYMANVLDQISKKTSAAMSGAQPAAGAPAAAP
ncbi:MAG: pilus assembly protein N-terminal domain-containing protein [Aestuariivirgaceae bacterium]|jgi:hypothetical protein|nr:pilus assembly protein N-terminal domain-containing protein [Aestuariivirgaceae bacterium]